LDRYAVVLGRPFGQLSPNVEARVVDLRERREVARAKFPISDVRQIKFDDDGRVVTMPVYWLTGGFRLARWHWRADALLEQVCQKLRGRITEASLKNMVAEGGPIATPCGVDFFARPSLRP
jgi:hypothetical protein